MKLYDKILIAKYNPENKCFAEDDTVLYVKPLIFKKFVNTKSHNFISTTDPSIKSRYGWIKDTESFTIDEFILKHIKNKELDIVEIEALEVLFESIKKFKADTPMATTYFQRGIEKQFMALTVHKVFFY